MISVRIAVAAERQHVVAIRENAFRSVRQVYTLLETSSATTDEQVDAVASIEGGDVGVISFNTDGALLRITGLGVLPKFRRRGVASRLLRFAERVAEERECRTLALFTIRETGNIEVFRRLGFVVVGEQRADWCKSDRFDALCEVEMRRPVG